YQTEEGKKVYPVAVMDSFTEDASGNTMQDEMYLTIPVEYLMKKPGKDGKAAYTYINEILLYVNFKKGEEEGEIQEYRDFDIENPDGAGRFYSMEPLDENDMMLPVYNVYETMIDTAQKPVRMYRDGEPDASDDLGVLVEPLPINKIRVFRGKGPEGWEKALAEEILDDDAEKDSYGLDTPYIMRDVFQSEYNLAEKTKMSLDIRWKQDRDNKKPRLPEGREITPSDFEPVVYINGEESREKTEEFGDVIMSNLMIEAAGQTVSFNGRYTISADDVTVSIKDDLSDYRKLVKGYDDMTEKQKEAVDGEWKLIHIYPSLMPLTIIVEKKKVSPEDEHSAMDSVMKLKPWTAESEAAMTMVKGQSYTFGSDKNGSWTTSDKKKLGIGNKKTGKVTAKAATEEDKPIILKDSVSGKEYHIVIVAPKIYERVEDGENQVYDPVKSLTLLTGKYRELCILSDDTKAPKDLPLKPVWISSNPRIVTADKETGRITGVAKGSAKVSAYLNGKAWSCTVKVTDVF
ncbi:MAG: Ig-like domain-containing protein, partial [Lachnospiraceae bacterium]|nr:Ig-like domain-containing protein [Lachnospiraceae bacterium]